MYVKDILEIDVRKVGCETVGFIVLAENGTQWWIFVKM
jgi:hypothetical protein